MTKPPIKDRLLRKCSVCGKQIRIVRHEDHSYRGGHYFGKTPLISKKEWAKAMKFGTRPSKIPGMEEIQVMRKDPKPYGHVEYWECPACYWGGK